MSSATDTISATLAEVDRLRATLKRKATKQVNAVDERSLAKATALAWFNSHRHILATTVGTPVLQEVDALYQRILDASDRSTSRSTYGNCLKRLRESLIVVRRDGLVTDSTAGETTTDKAPDFSPLTGDPQMRTILEDRWQECVRCIGAQAPLSATVMMGGLLETLLLGRINRETDKESVFKAKSAPKDKAGKSKALGEWMLKDYIDVTHDLKWITVSAKQVAVVLRDFRNYIHPHKQLTHGVHLNGDDAVLFWEVSKNITVQILKSCKP